MFRRTLLTLALIAALAPLASAETVDEIIAKSVAARGGMDKIKTVQTVRMTGKMAMGPGMEAPVIMEFRRPNQMKMQFTIQGMTGTQAYDGKVGWSVMPFMGKKDPEAMSADDIKEVADEADIDGPLVDWKAKGHTVELLGKEPVEGTDAYKVKVTLKSGTVHTIYIDAENFIEIKTEGKRMRNGTEMEYEGTLGDYKAVDGLMFPFSIENGVKGHPEKQKITFDKIEVNPPLAADYFTMPVKADSTASAKADTSAVKATDAKAAQKAEPAASKSSTPASPAKPKPATKKPGENQ